MRTRKEQERHINFIQGPLSVRASKNQKIREENKAEYGTRQKTKFVERYKIISVFLHNVERGLFGEETDASRYAIQDETKLIGHVGHAQELSNEDVILEGRLVRRHQDLQVALSTKIKCHQMCNQMNLKKKRT